MSYTAELHCPSCAAFYVDTAAERTELATLPCDFCGAHLAELGEPLFPVTVDENESRVTSAPWLPA